MTHPRFVLATAALICAATGASGETVTYIVDPAQSSLTISGTYEGDALQPLALGSLTESYTGAITADRDFTADTLRITTSAVNAQSDGLLSPSLNKPVNYAFIRPAGSDTNNIFKGTIVDLSLSFSSPVITSPLNFDISQFLTITASSQIDYADAVQGARVSTLDSLPMTGEFAPEPAFATIRQEAGNEVLVFPIETETAIPLTTSDGLTFPLNIYFSGKIVAVTSVPEPASIALLFMPAFLFLYCRRRRQYVEIKQG